MKILFLRILGEVAIRREVDQNEEIEENERRGEITRENLMKEK